MTDTSLIGELILTLHKRTKKLIDDGIIQKITIDTYNREIERYGHSNMEVSEDIFCIDSICICEILKNKTTQHS